MLSLEDFKKGKNSIFDGFESLDLKN